MTPALIELVAALRAALLADAGIAALVGDRVHEMAPRNAAFPYLLVDDARAEDISGAAAPLARHRLTLRAASRSGGRREALAITAAAQGALATMPVLPTHRIVALEIAEAEARTLRDRITAEAVLRLTLLTEPV